MHQQDRKMAESSSLRLLVVCTSHRVFGAEVICLSLLDELKARGHCIHAMVSQWTDGDFQRRLDKLGIGYNVAPLGFLSKTLRWQPMVWTANCVIRLPILWWRYWRVARTFQPDVVLLTTPRQGFLLYPLLDSAQTYIHVQYGAPPDKHGRASWRVLNRKLRRWISCSKFIAGQLKDVGIPAEKIAVVTSGILNEREFSRIPCIPTGPRVVVGIAGQVGAWKGHLELIQAAELLRKQGLEFSIKIFGSGPAEFQKKLRAEIMNRGLSSTVEWMGYQANKQKIFPTMDICAVPSRFEDPYPTVAMEAAGFGLPVVATRRGGLPEIVIDGSTGFLVNPEDPADLSEKLGRLIRDPELRSRLGNAAQAHAWQFFTQAEMAASFVKVFTASPSNHGANSLGAVFPSHDHD
jgi:glycosyltransferase involved in cell wall biosynthesis